ncbi:aldose epimerase [Flavobacterium akiainvivens]|uniref:Aldose 1-epimerase n=1 Tax=Flavobacterium akiainvivens TaxID=1202724 RepID=A0A0M9VJ68_9FLAO|nr:aldose epimerase family protein [Flavobacterium akiainvivens]KOS07420.1 aldose epimerase [Flavobacterium akiainvivens]SFQ47934.1 aldose 1-epimerase [Flavobacterium akiainvivens]
MQKNDNLYFTANCVTKLFGTLPGGRAVNSYTLTNGNGMEVSFINYGATITSIKVPSVNGPVDVALGFDTLEDYIHSFGLPSGPYFGSVIGRYAGRIDGAEFMLNGVEYKLAANNNGNTLHGGKMGFGRAYWKMNQLQGGENPSITFAYTSPDGEENFPGELTVEVTYRVTEDNRLEISYKAYTTADTVLNLTQHTYFNLAGHTQSIAGQQLYVNAESVLELRQDGVPTGEFTSLNDSEIDYRQPKAAPLSIDNSFVVNNDGAPAAKLYSPETGIEMTVFTDQPSVHIYVGGNCFGQLKGKDGAAYHTTSGMAFEAQNYPDAPNKRNFPSSVLKRGEVYRHNTAYVFENKEAE